MKNILAYKPQDYAYREMLLQFQAGKPLSCDQLNFLYRYEYTFNHPALDEVCRYYLKQYKRYRIAPISTTVPVTSHPTFRFSLPTAQWTKDDVKVFKQHLEKLFSEQHESSVSMTLTPDIFNHLRSLTLDRMVYLHGYRLTMHEGFFPGWFPYSIYLQWADVFGVAKYDLISDRGMTKTLVTLYLEPRHNRPLEECVQDYLIKNHLSFKPSKAYQPQVTQEDKQEQNERHQFTPQLTLSRSKQKKDEEQ